MTWQDRITIDPAVLAGKPAIRNTRLSVGFVVGLLGQDWTEADILRNYPGLTHDDIAACLRYASEVLQAEKVYPLAFPPHRLTMRFLANENFAGDAIERLRGKESGCGGADRIFDSDPVSSVRLKDVWTDD